MHGADKNLRHGAAPVGTLHHLGLALGVGHHVDFGKIDALLVQQLLGAVAKAADRRGVNFNRFHRCILDMGQLPHI